MDIQLGFREAPLRPLAPYVEVMPGVYMETERTCRHCGEHAPVASGVFQHRCVIVLNR